MPPFCFTSHHRCFPSREGRWGCSPCCEYGSLVVAGCPPCWLPLRGEAQGTPVKERQESTIFLSCLLMSGFSCDGTSWAHAVWWCHQAACAEDKLFETQDGSFCCLYKALRAFQMSSLLLYLRLYLRIFGGRNLSLFLFSFFFPKQCKFGILLGLQGPEPWLTSCSPQMGSSHFFFAAYPGALKNILISLLQRKTNHLTNLFHIWG